MATRWQTLLAAGILGAPLLAGAAPAQGKAEAMARARERAALVKSLPQGTTFRSAGRTYRLLGGVRAVARPPHAAPGETLAAVGSAPADLVEDKGPFLVFRQAGAASATVARAPSGGETLPVAVNTRTNGFGVVLGTIVVHLRRPGDGAAVAKDLGLLLDAETPQASMAFYRTAPGGDIQAAAASLARDPRVESAEIEVKEHFAVPM